MNFDLTDEQILLRDLVRDFGQAVVKPQDAKMDENNEIDYQILEEMKKIGLWGLLGPTDQGGAGADSLSGVIVIEELAKASGSIALTLDAHFLGLEGIAKFGTPEQKQAYLPDLCSGAKLGAFAWTEPCAGSDAGGIQTSAKQQDDKYLLNGVKCFVTNGGLAQTYLIGAVTGESEKGKEFSVFILDKSTPGLTIGQKENKMGMRGSHTTELILQDVQVGSDQLLGKAGQGFKIAMEILNGGRLSIAALSVGTAQAALKDSLNYAKERQAFGKPLAKQQAVQFMLANMDTNIQAARLLTYQAAQLSSQGKPYFKQAAQAKIFASEMAMRVCKDAIQIHGGYGYTKDFAVERYFRNAKLNEIGEGASEVLRMLVARSMLS